MMKRLWAWLQEKLQWDSGKPKEEDHCDTKYERRPDEAERDFTMSGPLVEAINAFRDELHTQYKESQDQQQSSTFWVKAGTVAVVVSTLVTGLQLWAMYHSLQAQQRAAVFIGTLDGKIGEIREESSPPKVFLYLHNYGQSAARRLVVEEWALIIDDNGFQGTVIPPRKLSWIDMGPTIPPGGTWEMRVGRKLQGFTTAELDAGGKKLWVIVRILYEDAFGTYCEKFWLEYVGPLVNTRQVFSFPTDPIADLCGGVTTTVGFSYADKGRISLLDGRDS